MATKVAGSSDSTTQVPLATWMRALVESDLGDKDVRLLLRIALDSDGGTGTRVVVNDRAVADAMGWRDPSTVWRRLKPHVGTWLRKDVAATRGGKGQRGRRARYSCIVTRNRLARLRGGMQDETENRVAVEAGSSCGVERADAMPSSSLGTSQGGEGDAQGDVPAPPPTKRSNDEQSLRFPEKCPKHQQDGWGPACGACGDARRRHERQQELRRQQRGDDDRMRSGMPLSVLDSTPSQQRQWLDDNRAAYRSDPETWMQKRAQQKRHDREQADAEAVRAREKVRARARAAGYRSIAAWMASGSPNR